MKNVVIVGGSKGIGEAIVEEFMKKGCNVIFTYNSSKENAYKIKERFSDYKNIIQCFELDVCNPTSVENFSECVEEQFDVIDGIIYCSGIIKDNTFLFMNEEDFNIVLDTNLFGCFRIIKSLLLLINMKKGASIVLMSSTGGIRSEMGQGNYAASKAGLIGFMQSLARELAVKNVRVNAVAPGFIETDMVNTQNSKIKKSIEQIPMKRLGKPNEVAKAVYFLFSEESSYITAQTLIVDGGRL